MKKSFFALLLFGVLPLAVSAQNPKGRFSVTPMAGINVTGLSGGTLDAYKYKVRMTAGAEAEYAVNDWMGLSLGAFYSQQGANIDWASAGTIIDAEGVEYYAGTEMDGKLHCDYLNLRTCCQDRSADGGAGKRQNRSSNAYGCCSLRLV